MSKRSEGSTVAITNPGDRTIRSGVDGGFRLLREAAKHLKEKFAEAKQKNGTNKNIPMVEDDTCDVGVHFAKKCTDIFWRDCGKVAIRLVWP